MELFFLLNKFGLAAPFRQVLKLLSCLILIKFGLIPMLK